MEGKIVYFEKIGLENTVIEPYMDYGVSWDMEYISVHMMEPDYYPLQVGAVRTYDYLSAFYHGFGGTEIYGEITQQTRLFRLTLKSGGQV